MEMSLLSAKCLSYVMHAYVLNRVISNMIFTKLVLIKLPSFSCWMNKLWHWSWYFGTLQGFSTDMPYKNFCVIKINSKLYYQILILHSFWQKILAIFVIHLTNSEWKYDIKKGLTYKLTTHSNKCLDNNGHN